MIIPRLATRNLFRCPRRSILAMIAIVAGIGVFILGEAFVSGVEENVRVSSIEGLTGHVLVRPLGYPSEGQHPVDELLHLDAKMTRFLNEETRAWTERVLFSPTVATGADHVRVRAIGYDPTRDPRVFSRQLWRLDGEEPDGGRDEILVTSGLAGLLEISKGDSVVMQLRTHQGAMNALQVEVTGVVSTGLSHIDTASILLPLELAHRLIDSKSPSHVAVRLASRDGSWAFKERLSGVLGEQVEIITWQEDARDLLAAQSIRRRALQFISAILLILAGFGMANTILMSAQERVREIGTLRSMGMSLRGVTGLFVTEGMILGLVGSLLGALWGGGLAIHWMRNPIDMTNLVDSMGNGNMAFSALVYTDFSITTIAFGIAFGVVVAVLSSIYPARVASNMAPADAVRAE